MKKTNKTLVRVLAVLLVVALMLPLYGCKNRNGQLDESITPTVGEKTDYTVTVKNEEGVGLEGIGIYVYEDATQAALVWFDKTNADGQITFTEGARDTMVAVLENIPTGYVAEEQYAITSTSTEIVLKVGVLDQETMANTKFNLGDKMMDFTVVDIDGKEHTLYELLKTKKAVVLNFWYTNCEPCKMEFPYMIEAYNGSKKDIEILAMNPVDTDAAAVAKFREEHGLPFPVIMADPLWESMMQITGYPTTIVIDRFGNISLIHKGSIESSNTFQQIFQYFAADDYVSKPIKSIEDIVEEMPVGTKENPFETGSFTSLDITVKPGETYYIRLYKQVEKYYLSVEGKNCDGDFTLQYADKKYEDEKGEVTVHIKPDGAFVPIELAITNNSKEEQTYTFRRSTAKGTYGNPYKLELGEFEGKVNAGNDQGVYYTYTAEKDGELRITCLKSSVGNEFGLTLYNLNSYAMRNWNEESTERDEDGNPYVAVKAKKGQRIQFILNTAPNDYNQYPTGTFTLLAAFTEGDGEEITVDDLPKTTYTFTAVDQLGNPVPNVSITFTGEFTYIYEVPKKPGQDQPAETADTEVPDEAAEPTEASEPTGSEPTDPSAGETEPPAEDTEKLEFKIKVNETLRTDDKGLASTEQISGTYAAAVRIPDGYRLDPTQYELTAEAPEVTLNFHKIIMKDYSVTLTYPDGTPVTGVDVMLGTDLASTDAAGKVTFHKEEGQYSVTVLDVPEGYVLPDNQDTVAFPEGSTELALTLVGVGGEENPYQITAFPYTTKTLAAGEIIYADIVGGLDAAFAPVLKVSDAAAVITYNGTPYTANAQGLLEIPMDAAAAAHKLAISHSAAEPKALKLELIYPIGCIYNPEVITSLSSFKATLAEGDMDGYYFSYKPTSTGDLTLKVNAVSPENTKYNATITSQTSGTVNLVYGIGNAYVKKGEEAIIHVKAQAVGQTPTPTLPALEITMSGSFEIDPDAIDETQALYNVTVATYAGDPISGAVVQLLKEGTVIHTARTDATGKIPELLLDKAVYNLNVAVPGDTKYYYDAASAVLTEEITSLTVQMTAVVPGEPVTPEDSYIIGAASMIEVGSTYVTAQMDMNKYYLFKPGEAGTYRITTSSPAAIPSYWGMEAFPFEIVSAYNAEGNYAEISVGADQLDVVNVIGIKGVEGTIVTIERVGKAAWNIEEEPYDTEWQSDYVPEKFTLSGSVNSLTYVDLMAEDKYYNLVFNEQDQFYHLNTADGPVLYLNFGANAPIKSIQEIMHGSGAYGGRGLSRVFLVEGATKPTEETFVKKEDYTTCMDAYIAKAYTTGDYVLYPVTKDIMYAVQNGCHELWDDPNNMMYETFEPAVDGREWMFAVCYLDDGNVDLSTPLETVEEAPELAEALPPKKEEEKADLDALRDKFQFKFGK